MTHNFFLSHFSGDKEVAEVIASVLHRISVRQLAPWYSSDSSSDGGLKPGNIWFNEILSKIVQSKALVAVLTPNSIGRPWIYFESGIGQALEHCEVIPVCVSVKRDSILPPLGMYQCYQLTDYKSLKEFVGKLLKKFDIYFDEEMSKPILEKALTEISKFSFDNDNKGDSKAVDFNQVLSELKSHIDKRFIDLLESQLPAYSTGNKMLATNDVGYAETLTYTITIHVNFPEYKGKQFLEVRMGETVQDVLNNMYFLLSKYIKPFTYMESWILRNPSDGQRMVLREIGDLVPAKYVFKQDIEWEAIKIKEEYKASSSKEYFKKS